MIVHEFIFLYLVVQTLRPSSVQSGRSDHVIPGQLVCINSTVNITTSRIDNKCLTMLLALHAV